MKVFISYRRDDSAVHAGRLHQNLTAALGTAEVFMDTSSIAPGATWAPELTESVAKADVVIALIGPHWLKASDAFGMRRIDQPGDWVRTELVRAIEARKTIIPVLVGGAQIPPRAAVPDELAALIERQAVEIRDHYWDHDVQLVLSHLVGSRTVSKRAALPTGPYPVPPVHVPDPMSDQAIARAIDFDLSGWSVVCSPLPEKLSVVRQELFKEFGFDSFVDAIAFMSLVAPGCDIAMHHPRWENLWRTLRVYLTTWDISHRISDRDIQLARYFDRAHEDFMLGTRSRK